MLAAISGMEGEEVFPVRFDMKSSSECPPVCPFCQDGDYEGSSCQQCSYFIGKDGNRYVSCPKCSCLLAFQQEATWCSYCQVTWKNPTTRSFGQQKSDAVLASPLKDVCDELNKQKAALSIPDSLWSRVYMIQEMPLGTDRYIKETLLVSEIRNHAYCPK